MSPLRPLLKVTIKFKSCLHIHSNDDFDNHFIFLIGRMYGKQFLAMFLYVIKDKEGTERIFCYRTQSFGKFDVLDSLDINIKEQMDGTLVTL